MRLGKKEEKDEKGRAAEKLRTAEKENRKSVNRISRKRTGVESGNSKNHILLIGIIFISFGVLVLLCTIIFNEIYISQFDDTGGIGLKICQIIDSFLVCAGTTLMTIGAGTALYSYFDFVNYMQDKIKDVIIDNNFTDNLSDEQKKELARKLEKEILHQNEGNNLYDFVQDEVLSLAKMAFYEEFTLNVSCQKKGSEIHKTICKNYIINCESQPDFDIVRNNDFSMKCKDNCEDEPVKDIKLSINGIDFTSDDYSTGNENTDGEVYNKNCRYSITEEARKKIDKIRDDKNWELKYNVSSQMKTIVQEDDMTFSFRLYYPCKNTTFIFTYNPDEFEVFEDVFVFKDIEIDENISRKAITTCHNRGSIFVRIDNWVLPGDGITFVLSPAKSKKRDKN